MGLTVTTMRLVVDESQPQITCCACGEVAAWAMAGPTQNGLYEMQPFCHTHFLGLVKHAEQARKRVAKLRAQLGQ